MLNHAIKSKLNQIQNFSPLLHHHLGWKVMTTAQVTIYSFLNWKRENWKLKLPTDVWIEGLYGLYSLSYWVSFTTQYTNNHAQAVPKQTTKAGFLNQCDMKSNMTMWLFYLPALNRNKYQVLYFLYWSFEKSLLHPHPTPSKVPPHPSKLFESRPTQIIMLMMAFISLSFKKI